MKRIIIILNFVIYAAQCFCQENTLDDVVSKIGTLLANAQFEEADILFKEYNKELDTTTCDILSSVINIGLSTHGKSINLEYTIDCIKRVTTEFSVHKEEIKSMSKEMMPYFNIYISFLTSIDNPFYIEVYKLFKEIWPIMDKDNSVIYIYILENTSIHAFKEQRYNDVIPILKELIEIKDQGFQLNSKPFHNYVFLGRCYQNTQKINEAATYYDKALIYFSSKDKNEELNIYMSVVRDRFELAFELSQNAKCQELGKVLLEYYDNKDEYVDDYIRVSMELADIELSAFNSKEGIQYYEKALNLILRSSNYETSTKKEYLENLYTIYNSLNINEIDRKFQSESKIFNINLGNKFTPIVIDDQYINILKGKIDGQERVNIPNVKQFVDDVVVLADNYSGKHQDLQGIRLIESAIIQCQSNNAKEQEYVKLYISLGKIYLGLHNIDKALEYHKNANTIYTRNGIYNVDYINNLCYLAEDYRRRGDFSMAKAHLEEAWEISQSMDAFTTEKVIYYHLLQSYSELYKTLGEEEKALSYNSMMIDDVSANDAYSLFKKVHQYARLQLLLYFDRYKEAQNLIDEIGKEFIETHDCWLTSFEIKYFNNDKSCVNDLEIISEKDKDYILQTYSSFDASYLKEYWDVYGGNLNMAYSMSLCKFDTPSLRISTYNNLLFTKNFQLELNKFNREYPDVPMSLDIATNIINSIGNVNTIKENLKENEVAVEFFFVNDRKSYREIEKKYGALILKKNSTYPIYVELCTCDSLDLLVYNNTIGEAEVYADQMYNINNSILYHLIWEPLEKEIPSNSKVYVSGCGSILYINFSAISNGKARLEELYDIHNVVSTSVIITNKLNKRKYQSATLFGGIDYDTSLSEMAEKAKQYSHENNTEQYAMYRGENERGCWGELKYSLEETNSIATYLSNNKLIVKKYTQSSASEEAFKHQSGSSPDIIHISTHGFFYQPYSHSYLSDYSNLYFANGNNNKLNFNGLLFSGANNAWRYGKYQEHVEDGVLTAKEIYSLNLSNTDLLVLSACQTGLGENNEIDGNEGLLRAFKVAGVNALILTLWNVSDDATSSIMKEFYKNLLEIKNPREAFKKTIKNIKQEMPDPYYWAPFIFVE